MKWGGWWLGVLLVAALVGCRSLEPRSHGANPLGWPARGLTSAGFALEDSEALVLAELGALLDGLGWLADGPALVVEGLVRFDGSRLGDGGWQLLAGTGATLTAALNLPFALVMGPAVDLGRDAQRVNQLLARLDDVDTGPGRELLPPGTRVRASGRNLIWSVPGRGELLQRAEVSWLFAALTALPGQGGFLAQERSWGFVVPSRAGWDALSEGQRAVTIVHEAWHQRVQIEGLFASWSLAYWPGYLATFPFTGWEGHWAETGPWGAASVERGLGLR